MIKIKVSIFIGLLPLLTACENVNIANDEPSTTRPNVIIIMTDDQGYGDLSFHGNPVLKTPNLDKLAGESVRFTDFHVSPFCTPSRAALMTGNYPAYTGAYRTSSGRTMMHPEEKTIADFFASEGYTTGMVGKWHLGDNAPHRPQDRGFDDVVWHKAGAVGQAPDYWGNDYFDDTYERNGVNEKFEGYVTDIWFNEGLRFIEENKEQPFFLYLALNAPHGPYRVADKWAQPYRDNKDVYNANFLGMIANIDHNMGVFRDKLAELGIADNTILIFMTDNGTAAGGRFKGQTSEPLLGYNAGMRGKKSSIYDGGHRVPFFIHWPQGGFNKGREIDTLAAHIDVLPTLAALIAADLPQDYDVDGVSLKPLLDDDADANWQRNHLVVQYHGGAHGKNMPSKYFENTAVLTERWRLINDKKLELYDIQADPAQRHNLAESHPDVVKKLKRLYAPFWERVSPRMTPVRIDIGNPAENPVLLSSQDWYMKTGNPPWNFKTIKRRPKVTGPWMLEVKRAGRYRMTLRQLPKEANQPIIAVRAKVTIAGQALASEIKPDSHSVVFELSLSAGPAELVTYLYDDKGNVGGAYFVDIEWQGEAG